MKIDTDVECVRCPAMIPFEWELLKFGLNFCTCPECGEITAFEIEPKVGARYALTEIKEK